VRPRRRRRLAPRLCVGALAVCAAAARAPATARGQSSPDGEARPDSAADTVVVVPGARYRAGTAHRALLGADYRDLWTTPISVEVLEPRAVAGGLRPTERGGGLQTRSLRFESGDGREYVFRSLDKDPGRALPPELRETLVSGVAQDQVSAFHPAGSLVVARLLDATGIRHPRPRIVVLPDDPLLGEFRGDFARQLGTFEERPGRGFDGTLDAPGAAEVISTERLLAKMQKSPATRVDARAFLAARLFDVFVGDRDRHRDQWRWARFGAEADLPWEPVPRDRDMAFVKNEGWLLSIARTRYPQFVTFKQEYPSILGLTWNAREIDRRLLSGLGRAVWDSVAGALQAQLTDSVIAAAVATMPPPFVAKNGAELQRALVVRRDRLRTAAADFYALLAGEVDLYGTDEAELAEVVREPDGSVTVALSARPAGSVDSADTYVRRRFDRRETREVRLYLGGGDDRAVVRRAAGGRSGGDAVTLRVVGGDGADELADSAGSAGETRFYDAMKVDRVIAGPRTDVDRRRYVPPPTRRAQDPPRDWGHDWRPAPWLSAGPDVGLFLGVGETYYRYGFRAHPYAWRATLQGGYAFGARRGRAQFTGELHPANSASYGTLTVRASGIELLRYHGLGNESPSDEPSEFYHVYQRQYLVAPSYELPVARRVTLSIGAVGQHTSTEDREDSFVGREDPYGSGTFGQAGARFGVTVDTRDRPGAASRGVHVTGGVSVYPALLDVATPFEEAHGTAATYLRIPGRFEPTVALRVGGKRVWGTFPFHESAFLGGATTLRGWGEQRFAGRSSAYGNAELRLFLGRVFLILPSDAGIFGLADVGRVFAAGEQSDRWHSGFGGGVWLAPIARTNTFSLAVARGQERTGVYFGSGFVF
jgi:hypothetical protein